MLEYLEMLHYQTIYPSQKSLVLVKLVTTTMITNSLGGHLEQHQFLALVVPWEVFRLDAMETTQVLIFNNAHFIFLFLSFD